MASPNRELLARRFPQLARRMLPHFDGISPLRFAAMAAEELVLLVAVTACAALAGCYYPWLALFLAFGMHLLIHLGQWAVVGRYVPVITTSLPCLACCGWGLCIMINSRAFSLREFVLCGMAGCVAAAVNLWLVHRAGGAASFRPGAQVITFPVWASACRGSFAGCP